MSRTMRGENSSSPNSAESERKFGLSKVVAWARTNISTLSAGLSVLCTAFVIAVTGGSTSHAIDTLENDIKADRIVLMQHAADIAEAKQASKDYATAVTALVTIAKDQGVIQGRLDMLTKDVSRLVDSVLATPKQ